MNSEFLLELLGRFQEGELATEEVVSRLLSASNDTSPLTEDACVDLDRLRRCGYAEVVYGEGKPAESIAKIFALQQQQGQNSLATRVSDEQAEVVLRQFPQAIHNRVARTVRLAAQQPAVEKGNVLVVSAGTCDRPVAEEACETLAWMGCRNELILDVGVAGPHRLLQHRDRLQVADSIVVVAGMEGALPSVVGGWVDCPVVAVPTSVGYGVSFGGLTAMLGMLNSCASNVTVVNINAGFKGAFVAGLIARQSDPNRRK